LKRLEPVKLIAGLNGLNVLNDLNAQVDQSVVEGVRNRVQCLVLTSNNPRVGEVKLEDVIDRSIMRKLDDSGFIDRAFAAAGVK
jgi:hypothetical protein